jgi:hypothetical protein
MAGAKLGIPSRIGIDWVGTVIGPLNSWFDHARFLRSICPLI